MKTNPPNIAAMIEAAELGDKTALARLYGQAAAWLQAGKAPPEPLAGWIAERLAGLSQALASHYDRKETAANAARAMLVTRPGKRGKTPKQSTAVMDQALAADVQHFIDWHGMKPYNAIAAVAAMLEQRDGINRLEKITAAWKQHGG